MINKKSKIYIAGHKGMVGSSLLRLFKKKNYKNLLTRSKSQLDLLDQKKTYKFLIRNKPDAVIIAAAKVGGINANNIYRGQFLFENLQIQNNLIHGSFLAGIQNLLFLGSSCIYPKLCKQPIREKYLLTNSLEKTNEPYAIAKIAGLKLIENYNDQYNTNYFCLMPCNLYGPNDNYDMENSHFIPAIIRKVYDAKINNKKEIILWGNGKPKRELMHVDDLSEACEFFLKKKLSHSLINIGSGYELTIKCFAEIIAKSYKYKGKIKFDQKMPNGTPRKILDCSIANKYGWKPKYIFNKEIKKIFDDFVKNNV